MFHCPYYVKLLTKLQREVTKLLVTESYEVATFPGAELNSNYMVPYFNNIYSEILMKYMYLPHTPSDEIPPNFFV